VALSDEQNAMLRLLAQGEQGYADIAALMGLAEDEVRAKVVGALAQLQAEGKPVPDVPPPIPGGAKPAAEVTPPEPEPAVPAESDAPEPVVADAVAPSTSDAEPTTPKPTAAPPASPPPSGPSPSGGRTITLPTGRNAWLLGGGVVAAIVVIVVVVLLASGGGGGGSSTATTEAGSTTAKEGTGKPTSESKAPTQAELKAVDGSEAEGLATFGRVKNKLALQIQAKGLEPTVEGTNSYTIWLARSPKQMIPLAFPVEVKGSGKGAGEIGAEFEVPVEILGYLANGTFDQIAITKTDDKRFEAAVEVAKKKKTTPTYFGEEILRGTVTGTIVGFATREEEEKKAEEEGK
jgi:hypothetical protein